jgi:very-short-patch-repair endonuclease
VALGSSSRSTGTPRTARDFAFEDDRARDVALVRAGWRVVRFTHAQIAFNAADVAAALRDLLGLGPFVSA